MAPRWRQSWADLTPLQSHLEEGPQVPQATVGCTLPFLMGFHSAFQGRQLCRAEWRRWGNKPERQAQQRALDWGPAVSTSLAPRCLSWATYSVPPEGTMAFIKFLGTLPACEGPRSPSIAPQMHLPLAAVGSGPPATCLYSEPCGTKLVQGVGVDAAPVRRT